MSTFVPVKKLLINQAINQVTNKSISFPSSPTLPYPPSGCVDPAQALGFGRGRRPSAHQRLDQPDLHFPKLGRRRRRRTEEGAGRKENSLPTNGFPAQMQDNRRLGQSQVWPGSRCSFSVWCWKVKLTGEKITENNLQSKINGEKLTKRIK